MRSGGRSSRLPHDARIDGLPVVCPITGLLVSPVLLIGAEVLPGKISVSRVCAAKRGRAAGAPLMLIIRGERLPGDRRTARLPVRARRWGTVAAGTACLRVRGIGAAAAPATGRLPPIGPGRPPPRSRRAAPPLPPQLLAVDLTPPYELPQRVAILRAFGEGRNGPARRGAPLRW